MKYVVFYESAEQFVKADPFVLGVVVSSWRILGWNEALTRGSDTAS